MDPGNWVIDTSGGAAFDYPSQISIWIPADLKSHMAINFPPNPLSLSFTQNQRVKICDLAHEAWWGHYVSFIILSFTIIFAVMPFWLIMWILEHNPSSFVNGWLTPNYWSCDCKSWSVALNVNYLLLQSLHQNYGNFACGKSVMPKSTLRLQLQLKLKPEVLIVCMKNWCGKDESFWSGQSGEGFGFLSSKCVVCQIFPC